MKKIRYLIEFLFIIILFLLFRILGYKISSNLGSFIVSIFGPLFRSKKMIRDNIKKSLSLDDDKEISKIINNMWSNYGRILSDYIFIKKFRSGKLDKYIQIEGNEILYKIKNSKKPVIFISGHFNNFELMAMEIEKSGIKLAAIYRPLNNIFLNKVMEKIRVKYICKNQIKKGISGIRQMMKFFKENSSIALMIDQRVSEGIQSNLFGIPALTTTIPAQMVKKFSCDVVPVYIQRINKFKYKIKICDPMTFSKEDSLESITNHLNIWLEEKIKIAPSQWIWSHNRWK
ncbi:lysophospholipid acyltransferase family protein [Candidatus Pelagibacter sp.]|nr:lysophospholipid acyltransferase family protein [Candidatus Pelagibacter sp.]